jgi:3'(2'), 5'-bisphosphate nucleotidase
MEFGKWTKEVNAAIEIIKPAITVSITGQEKLVSSEIETKSNGSVVSICDFACQSLIMDGIQRLLPGDYILGEENFNDIDEDFLNRVKTLLPEGFDPVEACSKSVRTIEDEYHRCWVIDPIDGTYDFVEKGNFAIAMALLVDKHVVCSAVAWPHHRKSITGLDLDGPVIFVASEGFGAFALDLNGKIIKLYRNDAPKEAVITSKRSYINRVIKYVMKEVGIKEQITMTSMTKGLVLAANASCAYIRILMGYRDERVWDIAPFEIIVREAGGFATLITGEPITYNTNARANGTVDGCVFTNKDAAFHEKVCKAIREGLKKYGSY